MPKVDLIATKDFKYNTRRLTAGDPFQASHSMDAMILTRVRKVAEVPTRKPKAAPAPVAAEPAKIESPKVEVKAPPKPATKKAPAKRKAKAKK